MKYLLIFWGIPVGSIAVWYYLSFNDIHFGYVLLSRGFNDAVFNVYGNILGTDGQSVRDLLIRTFVIDTLLIAAIIYFKPFKRIKAWWAARRKNTETEHMAELVEGHMVGAISDEPQPGSLSLRENNLSSFERK